MTRPTKIVSQAKQAFASLNISSIRGFDKLFSALVSLANSKIAVLSAKEKSDFKDNFNFYMVVCDAIKDSTLSFTLSNYVMSFVVGQVNSNEMSKTEAADYILSIFFLDKANVRVKENLTTLFEMLVCEEDSKSVQVVSTILAKLQKFDEPLYQSLRMKYIHATLNLIVEKVNSGTMNKADASGQILSLYFQDRNNTHIKQNITTLFEMLAMENDSKSIQAVSSVLTKLQTFDSSLYSKLNRINEDAKIQKELKSIVNLVNNKQMTNSSALSRVYKMYSLNPDNSGICQNLAQLCSICIMEYYISGQEAGYSAVQGILDSLKTNMSQEFRKHRDVFKEQYNVIWNQLPFVTKQLLSGISIYNQSLNENGKALKRGLEYMCSLGGFSINNSEFSFPPLIHR